MAEKAKAVGKKRAVKSTAKKDVTAKKAVPAKKAAPVAKSATAAAAKPAAPRRSRKPARADGGSVSPEQRWRMIAEAAYYRAEQSNFAGDSVEEWLAAESEIDAQLARG